MNRNMVERVLRRVVLFPESHDQLVVHSGAQIIDGNICGTTACLAGWAASFGGRTRLVESLNDTYVLLDDSDDDWVRVGAEELGISAKLANVLFFATSNDVAVEALNMLLDGVEEAAIACYVLDND